MKNKIFKKIEEIEGLLAIIILVALPCSFFSGYQVYMRLTHHGFEYYPVSSVKDLNDAFKKDYMFVEVNDGLLVKSNWVHIKKNLLFGFIPVTKTTTHYSFYFGSDNSRGWVLVKLSKEMKEAYIKNYSAKGRVSEYDSADKKIINHVRHGHFGNRMQTSYVTGIKFATGGVENLVSNLMVVFIAWSIIGVISTSSLLLAIWLVIQKKKREFEGTKLEERPDKKPWENF